jgi:TatD DNase family protein
MQEAVANSNSKSNSNPSWSEVVGTNQDPQYIDVHAHINFKDYDLDREDVIKNTLKQDTWMINVGTNLETSKQVVEIAHQYDRGVYAIVGLHPTEVERERFDVEEFEKLVQDPKVVAVGECGIDVFRIEDPVKKTELIEFQREDFIAQIELAVRYDKPIMIHARQSYGEILEIIDAGLMSHGSRLRGNVHFFAGTVEEARKFLERGFTLSFTGVITFASQYDDLIKHIPLESMLSETDCPFVSPVPFRGQRNQPLYVKEVVSRIADIKGLDIEYIKKTLLENAKKQFKI